MGLLPKHYIKILTAAFTLTASSTVCAYVGPGAGLSAIGALLALVLTIVVAIIGFVWYPLKRLLSKYQLEEDDTQESDPVEETDQ